MAFETTAKQPVTFASESKAERPATERGSEEEQELVNTLHVPSFSFSGCGFLGIYHIGVVDCLQNHIPHVLQNARFAGASAGALMAAGLACGLPMDMGIEFVLEMVTKALDCSLGSFDVELEIDKILRKAVERHLPPDAYKLCSGRLYVSVSQLKNWRVHEPDIMWRNETVSQFRSNAHLTETVLCSCYIPVFSGSHNPIMDDEITMDGAFTNNLPRVDENTITICPMAGNSDICPRDTEPHLGTIEVSNNSFNLSLENLIRAKDGLLIPSAGDIMSYYRQGFNDALRFLTERNLIRCPTHSVPTHAILTQPADPIDCEMCERCVKEAHEDKAMEHDEHFQNIAKRVEALEQANKVPPFSLTELLKLGATLPRELMGIIPILLRIGILIARGTPQAMRAVDDLLQKEDMRTLLKQVIDSTTDQHMLVKTILFRTSTLTLWKIGALLCRVLGYVASTKLWTWFKTYYTEAVKENKAQLARMKAAKRQERPSDTQPPLLNEQSRRVRAGENTGHKPKERTAVSERERTRHAEIESAHTGQQQMSYQRRRQAEVGSAQSNLQTGVASAPKRKPAEAQQQNVQVDLEAVSDQRARQVESASTQRRQQPGTVSAQSPKEREAGSAQKRKQHGHTVQVDVVIEPLPAHIRSQHTETVSVQEHENQAASVQAQEHEIQAEAIPVQRNQQVESRPTAAKQCKQQRVDSGQKQNVSCHESADMKTRNRKEMVTVSPSFPMCLKFVLVIIAFLILFIL